MNKIQVNEALFRGVFLVALFICSFARSSGAEYIAPDQVKIKTQAYTPERVAFPTGTYEYNVNWQGIPVGKASVRVGSSSSFGETGKYTTVVAQANSGGVVKLFYTLRHLSESTFNSSNLRPINFYSVQSENKKTKSREVSFSEEGLIRSALWKQGNSKPEEQYSFRSENVTFDPISAAFLARSLPVNLGSEYSFDVFNGKHRFLITLKVTGRETIRVAGQDRDAFKVVPVVKKLTDTEGEKRLRAATLWISADANREVLKLKSQVLVGSVNADLVGFSPNSEPLPSNTARASLAAPPELPANFDDK